MAASLKAYESFFSLIDVDGTNRASRNIELNSDTWFSQVFKAKSTTLPYIFFMGIIDDDDLSDLIIEIYESDSNYNFGTKLSSITADSSMKITKRDDNDRQDAYWYKWKCSLSSLTLDQNYIISFKTISNSNITLCMTQDYRESIFPIVLATSEASVSEDWSNSNFIDGLGQFSEVRKGALCTGFLGNDVSNGDTFDTGDIVLGGSTASRGYPVFLFIQNIGDSNIEIEFSMSDDGTYEEAETSETFMTWYYYDAATIPVSNKTSIAYNSANSVVLNSPDDFIVYTQPDKFPPYSKEFFPESNITLMAREVKTNIISERGEGYSSEDNAIQYTEYTINNTNDKLDENNYNWAKFIEKRNRVYSGESINADLSSNPSYLDFSLEKENDIENVFEYKLSSYNDTSADTTYLITGATSPIAINQEYHTYDNNVYYSSDESYVIFLNASDNYWYLYTSDDYDEFIDSGDIPSNYIKSDSTGADPTALNYTAYGSWRETAFAVEDAYAGQSISDDDESLRGFTNITKFNGKYIAFGKYLSGSSKSLPTHLDDTDIVPFPIIYSNGPDANGKFSSWTRSRVEIDTSDISGKGVDGELEFIGVYDVSVKTINESDYLFVIFQTKYSFDDNQITGASISSANPPAFLYTYASLSDDKISSYNILSLTSVLCRDKDNAYSAGVSQKASDGSCEDYSESSTDIDYQYVKFIPSPDHNYLIFTASNYHDGFFNIWKVDLTQAPDNSTNPPQMLFDQSGFRTTSISGYYQQEITSYCVARDVVYYGISTNDRSMSGAISAANGRMGEVFELNSDFIYSNIISGDTNQDWLDGYTYSVSDSEVGKNNSGENIPYFNYDATRVHYDWDVPSSKVAFMVIVGRILHVWMSPHSWSLDTAFGGTPLHVAFHLDEQKARVLKRFPTDADGEYFSVVNDSNQKYFQSSSINVFNNGVRIGDKIYLTGLGRDANGYGYYYSGTSFDHIDEAYDGLTPRWICYDARTINNAFYYHDDSDEEYHIFDADDYDNGVDSTFDMSSYNSTLFSEFSDPYRLRTDEDDRKNGVYGYYTFSKYNIDNYKNYPAISVSKKRPRLSFYCWSVAEISTTSNINFDGISGESNPRLLSQKGIPFLICDNETYGFHAYKTYGIFQKPSSWGFWMDGPEQGVFAGTENNLPSKLNNYIRSFNSLTQYKDKSKNILHSDINGIKYLCSIKSNEDGTSDNQVYTGNPYRFAYRLTAGTITPKNFSFYYKFNYLRDEIDNSFSNRVKGEDSITDYMVNMLSNTGNVRMDLKYARSWEDLFSEPDGYIQIPLAYDVNLDKNDKSDIAWYNHTLNTDFDQLYFRIESSKIPTPYDSAYAWDDSNLLSDNYDPNGSLPYIEILMKGLRFNDTYLGYDDEDATSSNDSEKTVGITGILSNKTSDAYGIENDILQDPEDIIEGGEIVFYPNNEIIIDFASQIFISEISFNAEVKSTVNSLESPKINISYINKSNYNKFSENIVSEEDWINYQNVSVNNLSENISLDNMRIFANSIRIKLISEMNVSIKNFEIKSFSSNQYDISESIDGWTSQFVTSGNVSNQDLIIVDDLKGLVVGETGVSGGASSFTSFRSNDAYIEIDLGLLREEDGSVRGTGGIPLNRISFNSMNGNGRKITVSVADTYSDGDWNWYDVYTNKQIIDYEYCLVNWNAGSSTESYKAYTTVISSTINQVDALSDIGDGSFNANNIDSDTEITNTNFSQFFASGSLNGHVFRPNIDKSRSITIVDSEQAINENYHGIMSFNTQMDGYGPFREDTNSVGIIEKKTNINFPVRSVRKIRIKVSGFSETNNDPIRLNGLKIYTPLIDNDGLAVWPSNSVNWDLKLNATTLNLG